MKCSLHLFSFNYINDVNFLLQIDVAIDWQARLLRNLAYLLLAFHTTCNMHGYALRLVRRWQLSSSGPAADLPGLFPVSCPMSGSNRYGIPRHTWR